FVSCNVMVSSEIHTLSLHDALPILRIQAKYERSLEVLNYLKKQGVNRTKSGIMIGLGETEDEVIETLHDLRKVNLDVVTIGQYLDRKSTRLNSSHVKISYVVFCLKK